MDIIDVKVVVVLRLKLEYYLRNVIPVSLQHRLALMTRCITRWHSARPG